LKKAFLTVFLILLADQALKIWVKLSMFQGESINVFGDWFILHFIENPGMAFGLEFGGEIGKLILSVFRIVAIGVIAYVLFGFIKKKYPTGLIIFGSMILAGAIGNILDSAFYGLLFTDSIVYSTLVAQYNPAEGYASFLHGNVVDMLYFPLFDFTWPEWVPYVGGQNFEFFKPIFNIADTAISTGIIAILVFQNRYFKKPEEVEVVSVVLEEEQVAK
jgi:signal peptidase II